MYVDLRKPEGDEEAALDDDRPISVRDALVFLEVAVFFSPASQPNAGLDSYYNRFYVINICFLFSIDLY